MRAARALTLAVSKQVAAVMTLDNNPVDTRALGVDQVRLQRVVQVMQQFLGFDSKFSINSMLAGG